MMLCRMIGWKRKTGTVPVYLNVYDLTPMNGYAYWIGLGIYHSGVQIHGVEYAFGAHEHSTTGIFEVEPKRCPGFTFRKSILIGRSDLGLDEVRAFMDKLAEVYTGNSYNLITKNCNHFCNDVCLRLTEKSIPRWVNRLARLGLFCNCVLPASLNETKVRHVRTENSNCEKKRIRSQSSRFASTSNPQKLTSTSRSTGARSCRHRSQHSSSSLSSSPLSKTQL
ncbi:hypothetical protein CASFOL_001082 [Castilleja foliolosa]|uniref:PPPDE domain-containing protein n=1 Tax=Castilleja foliolosa TaxID=1961234 RepID=A0ABD3EM24_9LAMI